MTKAWILVTVILMDLLAGMEFDLFVSSFPELRETFGLSPFWVEALLSVNFAGFCLSLFFVGGLADQYGRKPIIVLGLVIFALGSLLCLYPATYPFILIGRFLQGMGVAAPAILSFLIIADAYSIKQQQHLMALLNGSMNAAAAAAPVIGSYLTLYFHWQGNFTALLLLGLLVLFMTCLFLPKVQVLPTQKPISLQGYLPILKSKPLMLLIITLVFLFSPYWMFVGISPLLYMEDLGVSLEHFGYYQGVFALIFAIGSVLFGWFISKHDYDQKKWVYLSIVAFAFSLACVSWVIITDSKNALLITLSLIPFTVAQIVPSTILYPICINYFPDAKGRVSAMIQAFRLILTAFGLQLTGYYYVGSFQNIGLILGAFIIVGMILLCFVVRNRELAL